MQTTLTPPVPEDETQRLQRVQRVVDLPGVAGDDELRRLTALAARLLDMPFAQITLIDRDRQHVLVAHGMDAWDVPRSESVCTYAIVDVERPLVVNDLAADARFAGRAERQDGNKLRFYAGAPLDGGGLSGLGALCVVDNEPRALDGWQVDALQTLADAVSTRLQLLQARRSLESLTGMPTLLDPLDRRNRYHDLEVALRAGEFVNFYQPKYALRTRKLIGAEALMRWQHPQRGLLAPATFINDLDQLGLINEAGKRAAEQAVDDWTIWARAGLSPPTLAVNVAASQLHSDSLVNDLLGAVHRAGALSGAGTPLAIEITEGSLIEDQERALSVISALHEHGVRVALDDFGTGFSSLSYLATLPVDTLKIDRTFVSAMTEDPRAMSLVSTVIALAHNLEMDVVAEGIETEEQAKLLRLLRCEIGQGYLLGRPMSAAAFRDLLNAQ